MEEDLILDGEKLSTRVEKCFDNFLIFIKMMVQKEDDYEGKNEFLERLSEEIDVNYQREVAKRFDNYLNNKLNPNQTLTSTRLKRIKDKIKTLFSSKASTAFFSHFNKVSNGIYMGEHQPMQEITLTIPKNPQAKITIDVKINAIYNQFYHTKTGKLDTFSPRKFEATCTYSISRDGWYVNVNADYILSK